MCFTDYDRVIELYKKICGATGVVSQLSLPFPVRKFVAWKKS